MKLINGEAFDVISTGFEVASDVGEDGEMSIDRSGITFEDFVLYRRFRGCAFCENQLCSEFLLTMQGVFLGYAGSFYGLGSRD